MFHMCYYNSRIWENTYWHGHPILKCPLDMWIYQEMIWKIKPDYIIETGTFHGGSALYYAHLFDLQGNLCAHATGTFKYVPRRTPASGVSTD